jgi:hypothetical protein
MVIRQQQDQAAGQIYFAAGGSVGANPFVPLISPRRDIASPPKATGAGVGGGGASFPAAAQPTVGTESRVTCDPGRLISYLGEHPQAAAAWAQALNSDPTLSWSGGGRIEVQQIPAYIRELRPRVLAEDLRVTNYQFTNGSALAVQSILEKGTAVLLDARGIARTRCACGNPLTPMIQPKVPATYRGTPWPDFQPQRVIVIQRGPQCDRDDYYDGERCRRPAACPRGEYRGDEGRCYDHPDRCPGRQVRGDDSRCYELGPVDSGRHPDRLVQTEKPQSDKPQSDKPLRSDQLAQPDRREASDKPGGPGESVRPDQPPRPDTSGPPDQRKALGKQGATGMPTAPDTPSAPDKEGRPDQPSQPAQPETSVKREAPDKPVAVDNPRRPDQPPQPDKTGAPVKRDTPARPPALDKPGRPDQPQLDKPETPGKPVPPPYQDKPGQPGDTTLCGAGSPSKSSKCS